MSLDQFWRSTPRLTNLFVLGYIRRRAWAAFHAGYGIHCKDADIDHLLGRKTEKEPMDPEQMKANMRRIMVGVNAWRKSRGMNDGE
ncbi:MAG: hypothetical protein CL955_06830 [Erythrobacteraceae bacterium]|nr:hypothetical protein [Erythrobacteraceae bacterium]